MALSITTDYESDVHELHGPKANWGMCLSGLKLWAMRVLCIDGKCQGQTCALLL